MNLRMITMAAALSVIFAAPAKSASASEILGDFGFLGEWALNCDASPSPANSVRRTVISPEGEVSWIEDNGPGTIPNRYRVLDAERLNANTVRIRIELNGILLEELTIVKRNDKVRTISNKLLQEGRYLVSNGLVLSTKTRTQWLTRCATPPA